MRFYLFMSEAETQAEGEAGSAQGARRGTRSRDPGVAPWTEGRRSTPERPGRPVPELWNQPVCEQTPFPDPREKGEEASRIRAARGRAAHSPPAGKLNSNSEKEMGDCGSVGTMSSQKPTRRNLSAQASTMQ